MKSARELKLKNIMIEKKPVIAKANSKEPITKRSSSKNDNNSKKHASGFNQLNVSNSVNYYTNLVNCIKAKKFKNLKINNVHPIKIIKNSIKKHNSNLDKYNIKIVNDIIYDERKHIVCVFKDYLLWDENSDFLKRFYFYHEAEARIPKISGYYEKYSVIRPNYFKLDCYKILFKNIKKHKKYLEQMEENEERIQNEETEGPVNKTQYSKLMKTSIMNHTTECNINCTDLSFTNNHTAKEDNFHLFQSMSSKMNVSNIYNDNNSFYTCMNLTTHSLYEKLNQVIKQKGAQTDRGIRGNMNNVHKIQGKETCTNNYLNLIPKKEMLKVTEILGNTNNQKDNQIISPTLSIKKSESKEKNVVAMLNINNLINKSTKKEVVIAVNSVNSQTERKPISDKNFITNPNSNQNSGQNTISLQNTGANSINNVVNVANTLKNNITSGTIKKKLNLYENMVMLLKNEKEVASKETSKNKNRNTGVQGINGNAHTNSNTHTNAHTNQTTKRKSSGTTSGSKISRNPKPSETIKANQNTNTNQLLSQNLKTITPNGNKNVVKNTVFKSNTQPGKTILASSNNHITNITSGGKYLNNINSVYNINLNLNLNLNLKMDNKNLLSSTNNLQSTQEMLKTTLSNNSKENLIHNHGSINSGSSLGLGSVQSLQHTADKYISPSLTDRSPSSNTPKAQSVNSKQNTHNTNNEKYSKLSRNFDVKNFIMNYDTNTQIKKHTKNLIINSGGGIKSINTNPNSNNSTIKKETITKNSNTNSKVNVINKAQIDLNNNYLKKTISNLNTNTNSNLNSIANLKNLNNFNSNYQTTNTLGTYISNIGNYNSLNNKVNNINKQVVLNYNSTPISISSNTQSNQSLNSNAFNQKTVYKSNLLTSQDKKPLSINLKTNNLEFLKNMGRPPLTSRNEKEKSSVRIFSNI